MSHKSRLLILSTIGVATLVAAWAFGAAPAARVGDMHTCPMVTGRTPHFGGPVQQGSPNVLICDRPAARRGDLATCNGPPDTVSVGSLTVLINGRPAARQGSITAHGGTIMTGCPTVLIGG